LSLCCALTGLTGLTGLKYWLIFTQGVALGWYVAALLGLRKKMYTLVDLSDFFDKIIKIYPHNFLTIYCF
jgi:hypothetical protein